jgi:hypothetical protein
MLTMYLKNRDYIVMTNKGNTAKGIKPDLGAHYSTGIYPFLMDMQDLQVMVAASDVQLVTTPQASRGDEFPYKTAPMNQLTKDEPLCTFVVAWWTEILTHIPLPGRASVLPETPKPRKNKNDILAHYPHKPPWERRTLQCTAQPDNTRRV